MSDDDKVDWTFATERVHGRLIEESDRGLYLDLHTSSEVMASIAAPLSASDAAAQFDLVLRANREPSAWARYWRLIDAASGEALGIAGLVRRACAPTRAEPGVMLLPNRQHRGLGVQALAGVVEGVVAGRWRLPIERLEVRYRAANASAARLPAALGFELLPPDRDGVVEGYLDRSFWEERRDAWPMKYRRRE
jgi:RimJ/RimL family protein N-acetyltransferase